MYFCRCCRRLAVHSFDCSLFTFTMAINSKMLRTVVAELDDLGHGRRRVGGRRKGSCFSNERMQSPLIWWRHSISPLRPINDLVRDPIRFISRTPRQLRTCATNGDENSPIDSCISQPRTLLSMQRLLATVPRRRCFDCCQPPFGCLHHMTTTTFVRYQRFNIRDANDDIKLMLLAPTALFSAICSARVHWGRRLGHCRGLPRCGGGRAGDWRCSFIHKTVPIVTKTMIEGKRFYSATARQRRSL